MLSSTNTILMYMAVCDFLTIVFPAPWYIYTYTLHGYTSMEWTSVSCFLFEFFLETTPQLFRTTSIWLTLALAVQRYIYVCHAPQARIICTISKTKTVSIDTGIRISSSVCNNGSSDSSLNLCGLYFNRLDNRGMDESMVCSKSIKQRRSSYQKLGISLGFSLSANSGNEGDHQLKI